MKTARIAALVLAGLLLAAGTATPAQARVDVSFDFFYSDLSPHGTWMASGSYGNVWQPREYNPDWNPYYDGHWVYTDCGWTWVSDYDWGGVPYHYGTWVRDGRLGWVWVPGYVWGPSWVVFRSDADYIGWAPVPPSYTIGMSFGSINVDPSFYVFVPSRSFVNDRVRTVIVPRNQTTVIINKTKIVNNNITIVNNVVVNNGPDVRVVERQSGRRIERVPIERVRNVSPGGTFSRDEIRVDPARVRGHKVAEPVTGTIEEARARGGKRDAAKSSEPAQNNEPGQKARGGRRDREGAVTAAPAPNAPSAQRPDDATNARGRTKRNRPAETSTAPQQTPEPTPQRPDQREPRGRRRTVPENPTPPPEPRARPERPMPPPQAPETPRVKPNEPPIDPNTSNARKPVRTSPRQKGKPAAEKSKTDEGDKGDKKEKKPDEKPK